MWYRFTESVRQTNFVDFGIGIGVVCDHLANTPDVTQPSGHVEIADIRLRASKLAFDTSAPLAAYLLAELKLEAG